MKLTIVIETEREKEIYETAEKIHNSLAGNQDYIDSNIVLNFDNSATPQEVFMFFDADKCEDDYVSEKIKKAVDFFLKKE